MVTGSVANAEIPGRPKYVVTDKIRRRIEEKLKDDPGISSRKVAKEFGISQTSAFRALRSMNRKTY